MITNPIYLKLNSGSEIGESDYIPEINIKETKEMLDLTGYSSIFNSTYASYDSGWREQNGTIYARITGFKANNTTLIIHYYNYNNDRGVFQLCATTTQGVNPLSAYDITSSIVAGSLIDLPMPTTTTRDIYVKIKLPKIYNNNYIGFISTIESSIANFIAWYKNE